MKDMNKTAKEAQELLFGKKKKADAEKWGLIYDSK